MAPTAHSVRLSAQTTAGIRALDDSASTHAPRKWGCSSHPHRLDRHGSHYGEAGQAVDVIKLAVLATAHQRSAGAFADAPGWFPAPGATLERSTPPLVAAGASFLIVLRARDELAR